MGNPLPASASVMPYLVAVNQLLLAGLRIVFLEVALKERRHGRVLAICRYGLRRWHRRQRIRERFQVGSRQRDFRTALLALFAEKLPSASTHLAAVMNPD